MPVLRPGYSLESPEVTNVWRNVAIVRSKVQEDTDGYITLSEIPNKTILEILENLHELSLSLQKALLSKDDSSIFRAFEELKIYFLKDMEVIVPAFGMINTLASQWSLVSKWVLDNAKQLSEYFEKVKSEIDTSTKLPVMEISEIELCWFIHNLEVFREIFKYFWYLKNLGKRYY